MDLTYWLRMSVHRRVQGRVLETKCEGIHGAPQAWLGICLYVPEIRMMSIVQPGNQMGQCRPLSA